MALQTQTVMQTARTKPQVSPDGTVPSMGPRAGRYAEQIVQNIIPGKQALADEGSYFIATNATLITIRIDACYGKHCLHASSSNR